MMSDDVLVSMMMMMMMMMSLLMLMLVVYVNMLPRLLMTMDQSVMKV